MFLLTAEYQEALYKEIKRRIRFKNNYRKSVDP